MTTIQLEKQEESQSNDIIERNALTYMLENGANITILKQIKRNTYRNVIYLDCEDTTHEQRVNGVEPRYAFFGSWFNLKSSIFTKQRKRQLSLENLAIICEEAEKKIKAVYKLDVDVFRLLTGINVNR